ncbi:MAG: phospholipase D family protein [Rhodospirillales bacterium]|nr:phospholipase D family protein [Rhodospirillales bacterium]
MVRAMRKSIPFATLAAAIACLMLVAGCAGVSLRRDAIRPEPTYARPPATTGVLADMARRIAVEYGPDASGFKVLDGSEEALDWRLALIDTAVSSVDIQTYLWYPDNTGRLMLERAIRAAQRGVHVRLIVDDLLTVGLDQLIVELENQPNFEIRLFNPWAGRSFGARLGELVAETERLNTRMHDKLVIVDGVAAVVGGRNIGDHYFGISHAYNFHDLDLIGIGRVAQQANAMFDAFWNGDWVVSARNLDIDPDPEFAEAEWKDIQTKNRKAKELSAFPREVQDWSRELADLEGNLRIGTSEVAYDEATGKAISQNMAAEMFRFLERAQHEVLITNAYIIPGEPGIDLVRRLTGRGVKVRILTNSLASHDVPAVNSHYEDWRDDLVKAGAELYELRADAAIRSIVEVPPVEGEFVGLHTKSVVVDGRYVFIGSMNFDPRSSNINTEAGAFIDSPTLAADVQALMERDMAPDNAWQVFLDESGEPYWVNSRETVTTQPARDTFQRVLNVFFKAFPRSYY